jgi:putative endonuclease
MNGTTRQKTLGTQGELLVIELFIANGFTIAERNYQRFSGEIDIIAYKQKTAVFIEVKTRHKPLFDMTELISHTKQRKIIATAKLYCAEKGIVDMVCRFDVALVTYAAQQQPVITIIENAFTESLQ